MKIGVISNPLSRRNRKFLAPISRFLDAAPCRHIVLESFSALRPALDQFAAEGVELLVINGGDGTVSATMTHIWVEDRFLNKPLLAVIPGGTSNTIAADVGLCGDPIEAVRKLIANGQKSLLRQSRTLIRVDYDAAKPPVCGMFFGTAAICDAIELRRRMFPQKWLPDPLAAALTLIHVLGNAALGRASILSGQEIGISLDDEIGAKRMYTILIATSLRKILLGSSPFWGEKNGSIKMTSIAAPARGLLRNVYRLLYGSDRERLPAAIFFSASADSIELDMQCPFNLDGEFYQSPPGQTTRLSRLAEVVFVQC